MITYVLVRHKVKDYAIWKGVYDSHLQKRIEAGLTERYLFRTAEDGNNVLILFETRDIARAKAFAESTDLKETMERAGVLERPDIIFLHNEAEAYAKVSGF